jgi:hypothetical protein
MYSGVFGQGNRIGPVDFVCDPVTGLPVHFKTKGVGTHKIALSSLKAFIDLLEPGRDPFALAVVTYQQRGDYKHLVRFDWYRFNPDDCRQDILGGLTASHALYLENLVKQKQLSINDARELAKTENAKLAALRGWLTLHPKIDCLQRRWQCALSERFIQNPSYQHQSFDATQTFRGLDLSTIVVRSCPRQF